MDKISTLPINNLIREAFPDDGAYDVEGAAVFLHKRRVYTCGLTEQNKAAFALKIKALSDANLAA